MNNCGVLRTILYEILRFTQDDLKASVRSDIFYTTHLLTGHSERNEME